MCLLVCSWSQLELQVTVGLHLIGLGSHGNLDGLRLRKAHSQNKNEEDGLQHAQRPRKLKVCSSVVLCTVVYYLFYVPFALVCTLVC